MAAIKFNIGGNIVEGEIDLTQISEGSEIEVNADNLIIYESDSFETYKTNLKKTGYDEGRVAGVEMAVKRAREDNNLDFEGKTIDNLITAVKTKVEAESKVEPTQIIKDLQSDNDKLRDNYKELELTHNSYKSSVVEKETRVRKDNYLSSLIPAEGLAIDKDIALMAIKTKAGIDVDFDDQGKEILTRNGEVMKDPKTLAPIEPSPIILNTITEMGLIVKPNGNSNGDSDDGGNGDVSNYDKFVKQMESNGVNEGSMEFSDKMTAAIKDGTLKM